MAEFESAAGGIEAVEIFVIASNHGEAGNQVRIGLDGGAPLDNTQIGSAGHADAAVGPGLVRDPVDGVAAVGALLFDRAELAARAVAATHVLDNYGVTVAGKGTVAAEAFVLAIVGSADENCG